ncbi:MAG: glycerophosphodiester phosphodiesterase family protein [Planctomycetota bacterium]
MDARAEGVGRQGERVPGPPWILGHRGAPLEAPENTLTSLRRALEHGLDGIEYDLRVVASGEAIVFHDETLERTSDGRGWVAERTQPEIAGLDAGGWFHRSFEGEPIPLLEEVLELGQDTGTPPIHMIELKDPPLVGEVVRALAGLEHPPAVRLASFQRAVCLEARDLGLQAMLLAVVADESDRRFVRDERLPAYGVAAGGWRTVAGAREWDSERWEWAVDSPEDLLAACRRPLAGFNTNVPQRALAVRALLALAGPDAAYPLAAPRLVVDEGGAGRGAWSGAWSLVTTLQNPFPFRVAARVALALRGGAFEERGLPAAVELGPNERVELPLDLRGGSFSPGRDPHVVARLEWRAGPGLAAGSLVFDAPLERIRHLRFDGRPVRLALLMERPDMEPSSLVVRTRGRDLLVEVEDAGGLEDVRAWVRVGFHVRRGGRGVRLPLDATFTDPDGSLPFSVGFQGRAGPGAELEWRRWCGGLPAEPHGSAPGRLTLTGALARELEPGR